MTISKKLILMLPLIFGMHFAAQAQDSLENEVNSILLFAQTLREENSTEANKIAEWLVQRTTSKSEALLIKNLASILSNSALTTEFKTIAISQEIEQEIAEQKRQRIKQVSKVIGATILGAGFIGLTLFSMFIDSPFPQWTQTSTQEKTPIFSFVEKKGYWPFSYTTTQSWHL